MFLTLVVCYDFLKRQNLKSISVSEHSDTNGLPHLDSSVETRNQKAASGAERMFNFLRVKFFN